MSITIYTCPPASLSSRRGCVAYLGEIERASPFPQLEVDEHVETLQNSAKRSQEAIKPERNKLTANPHSASNLVDMLSDNTDISSKPTQSGLALLPPEMYDKITQNLH